MVTTAALLVGGTVGWRRYLRGRGFHAKCELEVSASNVSIDDSQALLVFTTVTNAGTCRLVFKVGTTQELQVCASFDSTWSDAELSQTEPNWDAALFHIADLFSEDEDRGDPLEPGQRLVRCFLIPVPPDPHAVALRVRLVVEACPMKVNKVEVPHDPWSTEVIVMRESKRG